METWRKMVSVGGEHRSDKSRDGRQAGEEAVLSGSNALRLCEARVLLHSLARWLPPYLDKRLDCVVAPGLASESTVPLAVLESPAGLFGGPIRS